MKTAEYHPHTEPSFTADALLPCPFCGGEAELLFIGNSHTKSRKAEIKCKKCFARIINAALRHSSEWVAKHSIDDWNKRHNTLNRDKVMEMLMDHELFKVGEEVNGIFPPMYEKFTDAICSLSLPTLSEGEIEKIHTQFQLEYRHDEKFPSPMAIIEYTVKALKELTTPKE